MRSRQDYLHKFRSMPVPLQFFVAIIIIPTLITVFYYGIFASDVYIAEAKYALRQNTQTQVSGLFESMLSGGSVSESPGEDTNIVRDYIHSREMIVALDQALSIRDHYSSDTIDFISRFDAGDSQEKFLAYFRNMVELGIDTTTNISTLRVRAFDPSVSHQIAQTIIKLSEELVNSISSRIVEDSLQFARAEVEAAETRVRAASTAMTRFRSDTNSINPGEETKAVLGIITELESQLAVARTQLIEAQGYMQRSSPQVQVLRGKVDALEKQVIDERKRLSNDGETGVNYTTLIDSYQPLLLEQELATKQYASTLASLEVARIEAQKQQRYLLPFVPPQIPDEAVEPKRLKSIITVFLGLCIIYAIGGLIWAAIKDHMRI